jgi:hypothetical protein
MLSNLCRLLLAGSAAAALAGCATPGAGTADAEGWQAVALPGKASTRYSVVSKDGRPALKAESEASASLWRRPVDVPASALGELSFSWWVATLPEAANVAQAQREDSAARVLLGFDGDHSQLPARTRALFDLAEALSGERPPYATLMYVWDATAPVGSVIINPRSDRIRKIVVDSGTEGLGRWRDHRRDIRADFLRAFGEEPGPLRTVAKMTDSDNTASRARAWYGRLELLPALPRATVAPAPQNSTSPEAQSAPLP